MFRDGLKRGRGMIYQGRNYRGMRRGGGFGWMEGKAFGGLHKGHEVQEKFQ